MTNILITGASGQYGRSATDKLIALGRASDLILMTRTPAKLADRAVQGCTVRYGDYDKPETLAEAVEGAEEMLLISGTRVGARVVQHKAAIDAAVSAGVKHIAYTSFIGIDDPANPAEVRHDHIETERLIRASGMAWTMLRDAHYADAMIIMAGPGMMASKSWPHNWGDGREAMFWREDCVECAVAVLTGEGHEGQIYNITGPELQTCAELAALVSEITGIEIASAPLSDDEQYAMFDAMGIRGDRSMIRKWAASRRTVMIWSPSAKPSVRGFWRCPSCGVCLCAEFQSLFVLNGNFQDRLWWRLRQCPFSSHSLPSQCHCEERSDEAIYWYRRLDCRAPLALR